MNLNDLKQNIIKQQKSIVKMKTKSLTRKRNALNISKTTELTKVKKSKKHSRNEGSKTISCFYNMLKNKNSTKLWSVAGRSSLAGQSPNGAEKIMKTYRNISINDPLLNHPMKIVRLPLIPIKKESSPKNTTLDAFQTRTTKTFGA